MEELVLIQNVIEEYFKSEIQSEAEVSSKFIVPLSNALGYPTELMALEFPVYGFGENRRGQVPEIFHKESLKVL